MGFGRSEFVPKAVSKGLHDTRQPLSDEGTEANPVARQISSHRGRLPDEILLTMDVLVGASMAAAIAAVMYFTVR